MLPALVEAVGADARTCSWSSSRIRPKRPSVYEAAAARRRERHGVAPDAARLAPLLAAARAIVTVNSTVAIDALVLGMPALVIGLPNNLTPVRRRRASWPGARRRRTSADALRAYPV